MPSDAAILGFDTSGPWCSAALLCGQRQWYRHVQMARGQGESLMPLLEDLLSEAGIAWRDLDALGVGTGPGNFTGIRISVSAARGLALGLGIPAVGVSRFEALGLDGPDLATMVGAPRGQAWYKPPEGAPELVDPQQVQGPVLADPAEFPLAMPPAHPLAVAIAHIAAARRHTSPPRPAPLYLRDADAAPPSELPPALLA